MKRLIFIASLILFSVSGHKSAAQPFDDDAFCSAMKTFSKSINKEGPIWVDSFNIDISMDGKGRWMDNVFVERLWRSLKYEEVYLKAYDSVADASRSIAVYFRYFNEERRHSSLGRRTPDNVFFNKQPLQHAA